MRRRESARARRSRRLRESIHVGGTRRKDRHWEGKVSEVGMFPNVQEFDEGHARQLVHWMLSFAP